MNRLSQHSKFFIISCVLAFTCAFSAAQGEEPAPAENKPTLTLFRANKGTYNLPRAPLIQNVIPAATDTTLAKDDIETDDVETLDGEADEFASLPSLSPYAAEFAFTTEHPLDSMIAEMFIKMVESVDAIAGRRA